MPMLIAAPVEVPVNVNLCQLVVTFTKLGEDKTVPILMDTSASAFR